jgi:hypothetical protein
VTAYAARVAPDETAPEPNPDASGDPTSDDAGPDRDLAALEEAERELADLEAALDDVDGPADQPAAGER